MIITILKSCENGGGMGVKFKKRCDIIFERPLIQLRINNEYFESLCSVIMITEKRLIKIFDSVFHSTLCINFNALTCKLTLKYYRLSLK